MAFYDVLNDRVTVERWTERKRTLT